MTSLQSNTNGYEVDRNEQSQAIVVKHVEDHSSGTPLLMGFIAYILLLPVFFMGMSLSSLL